MGSSTTTRILVGVAAVLIMASEAVGQEAASRRSIEPVSGGVYTATNNNHRTVFLVTSEGIVLADPINADFSDMCLLGTVAGGAPGQVNTTTHDEGFPWPVELADGRHLFFVRAPRIMWSEPVPILDSLWQGAAWGAPARVLEPELSAATGALFLLALPAVSRGDFGTELFFVYAVQHGAWVDLQIGVVPRD